MNQFSHFAISPFGYTSPWRGKVSGEVRLHALTRSALLLVTGGAGPAAAAERAQMSVKLKH